MYGFLCTPLGLLNIAKTWAPKWKDIKYCHKVFAGSNTSPWRVSSKVAHCIMVINHTSLSNYVRSFNLACCVCFSLLRDVRGRIQAVIAETFGLDPTLMYLTKPTFFSRINSTEAKTQHDEYWHPHIDKVTHRNRAATPSTLDNF